ncbi:MAG: hypothetical protein AAB527_02525 [Patescibacteria group bacterium]
MTDIESPKIIQEEIRGLELRLAEKQKELAESGAEFKPETAAKEVVQEFTASPQPAQTAAVADETKKAADKLASEPHAKQIDELLKVAEKNGILYAVNIAKHLKNPHLLDDFHDRLVLELLKQK